MNTVDDMYNFGGRGYSGGQVSRKSVVLGKELYHALLLLVSVWVAGGMAQRAGEFIISVHRCRNVNRWRYFYGGTFVNRISG